jgi:hypothetical protein
MSNPDQIIKIMDIAIAAMGTVTRANDLLERARAGEPISDADIDDLVAESDTRRAAFNQAISDEQ